MTSNEKNLFHLHCKQFRTWHHLGGEGEAGIVPTVSWPCRWLLLLQSHSQMEWLSFSWCHSAWTLWTDTTVWYPCYHGLWVRSAPPTSSPWIVYPSIDLCVCCTGSHWLTRTHESCPDLPRRWYWKYITNKAYENKYIEWESMYFRHISPWAGYNFLHRMTR